MSGILMDGKKALTEKDVEEQYGITQMQQIQHRSKLGMPYQKIGQNILYSKRKLEIFLLGEQFEQNRGIK